MSESLSSAAGLFIAYKRALGRKYHSEERELRLLVRFAESHGAGGLGQLTPALLEEFLASRPRSRPRSFNHLRGVVAGLLDWAVTCELLDSSPLQVRRRRVTSSRIPFLFDARQARQLLDAAAALPDNPRAPQRGLTYCGIFALCYGLGLRAGEACGCALATSTPAVTRSSCGAANSGRAAWSRMARAQLVAEQAERRRAGGAVLASDAPLFSFDGQRCVHPGTASQTFHHLVAGLDLSVPAGVSPPRLHD